jgi:hypothetical protein
MANDSVKRYIIKEHKTISWINNLKSKFWI